MLPNLAAPPNTRFPSAGDDILPFAPKGALRGRLEWADFLGYHDPSARRFTLLAIHEESVSAAACVEVRKDDLFIDYLARNDLFRPVTLVAGGSVLVAALEVIGHDLRVKALRLDSVDDPATLRWYASQGFVEESPPRLEPGWGTLHPMVLHVGRAGAP